MLLKKLVILRNLVSFPIRDFHMRKLVMLRVSLTTFLGWRLQIKGENFDGNEREKGDEVEDSVVELILGRGFFA